MKIEHELHINAPVETVWRLTEDVEAWPTLTPTITSVKRLDDGPMAPGKRARIKQPMQMPATWTVTRFEPGRFFAWETKVMGIRMVGSHEMAPEGEGCRNHLAIDISGPGSGIFGRLFGGRIRSAIETENAGFKRAAEAG